MRIFERWSFGLCWNLRLVLIELWYVLKDFLVPLEHFKTLNPKPIYKATVWQTPYQFWAEFIAGHGRNSSIFPNNLQSNFLGRWSQTWWRNWNKFFSCKSQYIYNFYSNYFYFYFSKKNSFKKYFMNYMFFFPSSTMILSYE